MQFITFISNIAIPFIILIIVLYGLIERKKVFDTFLDGAKEGLEIVLRYISNTYRVICCNRNIKKFRYNRCNCKFIKSNSKFNKFPK